ncbi:hypothetical protein BDA99DRAFT_606263 [Phascolomyces articulosus]|uniref:GDP/GTP exchange factor Sec2 N-terminal domain-containing protein n=1 Tax=Phascolomyces articulosus TaxID=60185 RepID=A0AAD5JWG5_9FUNG|nr:hypothetical protein BDA99DRAFT_606263 [Phascolomyces articulosus]
MPPKDLRNATQYKRSNRSNSKKDDLTRKDIANLYTQLESVVERVSSPVPAHSTPPLPDARANNTSSPTLTHNSTPSKSPQLPTSSSPAPLVQQSCDCPHRHIFIPNKTSCALCDQEIPQMTQLNQIKEDLSQLRRTANENKSKIQELQQTKDKTEQQLNHTTSQLNSLRQDMQVLNDKYVDEIERVAEIQHGKEMVENELEELSQRLFEEANGMVAMEKKEKFDLQESYNHLQEKLNETRERLAAEEMQLKELRQKVQDGTLSPPVVGPGTFGLHRSLSTPMNSNNPLGGSVVINGSANEHSTNRGSDPVDVLVKNDPEETAAYDLAELFRHQLQISTSLHRQPPEGIDTILIEDFQDFIISSPNVALKKVHSLPFMKHCLTEDIEPCLRFGPHSRMSARKLIDAIILNTCFIEDTPPGFAKKQAKKHFISEQPLKISALKLSMWERFSNDDRGMFQGCQACGRQDTPLPYRFRISYMDDWACIDRYCRDRLVAVCEFFVFIRNIRQGYYGRRTIPDLYHELIRLKLQIFYVRMGVLPWIMTNLGVRSDTLGAASEPQMSVPPTPDSGLPPPSPLKDPFHLSTKNEAPMVSPLTLEGPVPPPSPSESMTPSLPPPGHSSPYQY